MPNALEVMSPLAAVLGHKGGKKAPSAKPEEEDGIKKANDAIASSKKVLESANKAFPSAKKPMVDSAKAPAAKPAPKTGLGAEAESAAAGIKAKQDAVKEYTDAMPKMHDGGKVKEDGPKNLQKGEVVIPKDKAEKAMSELDKKAKGKGPMESAVEESEHETPAEEKAEGAKGEAKEGEHKKTSDKHNPAHEGGKKKVHVTVIHHHKHGHTMHHMDEDGASTMHQFALGDHAAMGKNIGDMLQANGQGAPEEGAEGGEQGGEPQGSPMQGAPQQ